MGGDVAFGAVVETNAAGRFEATSELLLLARLNRVLAVKQKTSGIPRALTRFGKGDKLKRSETHGPGASIQHVAQ
ncbi:MAG: hypothetical protein AB7O44_23700 [Hyphomicrobiaceae bacterium]